MKIRMGFVSNSSTTSFHIIGHTFDADALAQQLDKLHPELKHTSVADILYNTLSDNQLKLDLEIGQDSAYMYVGLAYERMGTQETRTEFEHRIQQEIEKLYQLLGLPLDTSPTVGVCSEAWPNY